MRIHEYLYRVALVFLDDQLDFFSKDTASVLPLLRLIDCVSWNRGSRFDDERHLSSLKAEYTELFIKLGLATEDLSVLQEIAHVLSNAKGQRSWPGGEQQDQFLVKLLTIAEGAEQCQKEGDDEWLKRIVAKLSFRLELDPAKQA